MGWPLGAGSMVSISSGPVFTALCALPVDLQEVVLASCCSRQVVSLKVTNATASVDQFLHASQLATVLAFEHGLPPDPRGASRGISR